MRSYINKKIYNKINGEYVGTILSINPRNDRFEVFNETIIEGKSKYVDEYTLEQIESLFNFGLTDTTLVV